MLLFNYYFLNFSDTKTSYDQMYSSFGVIQSKYCCVYHTSRFPKGYSARSLFPLLLPKAGSKLNQGGIGGT